AQAYQRYGAAVNEAANASFKKKLQDKNQVDDLNRLGIGLDEATKINGTAIQQEQLLQRVRSQALATGEVRIAINGKEFNSAQLLANGQQRIVDAYVKTGKVGTELIKHGQILAVGNTSLVKTFEDQSSAAHTTSEKLVELTKAGDAQAA